MIVGFQNNMNRGALLLALVGASQILPYISFLSRFYYPAMIVICIYALVFKGAQMLNYWIAGLVLVSVFGILLSNPDGLFQSWQRLISFVIVVGVCGPFIQESYLYAMRKLAFAWTMLICAGIGVGSFVGYFFGINKMAGGRLSIGVGIFGGLTSHSMILGPGMKSILRGEHR